MGDFPSNERVTAYFKAKLEKEGFEVTVYEKEGFEVMEDTVESFKSRYDLVLYLANIETASICKYRKSISPARCTDGEDIH